LMRYRPGSSTSSPATASTARATPSSSRSTSGATTGSTTGTWSTWPRGTWWAATWPTGHDLIHKAVGGWLRKAGKKDRPRLLRFLDEHAAEMPRTMLRYAMEHLDEDQRARYRGLTNA
jgi:DNA alkylation repair enzyme